MMTAYLSSWVLVPGSLEDACLWALYEMTVEKVSLAVKVTVRLDFPIEILVEDRKFPECMYVSIVCKRWL